MPDAPPSIDLAAIRAEVRSGLRARAAELECYAANEAFFRRENRAYFEQHARRESEDAADFAARPKQFSYMTSRAVRALTSDLYCPGPERSVRGDATADAFLQSVYADCHIDALMQRADRKATVNGTCAVQVVATGTPDRPVRLYLWGAEEFVCYFADDDPMVPAAVVTKSIVAGLAPGKKRRKYQVWTPATVETWATRDFDDRAPDGTAADVKVEAESGANPYGCIPFAFAFNELPVDRFGAEGIGTALREANQEVDRMLSDLAQLLECYSQPEGFVSGVSAAWRYEKKPGHFARLPADPGARQGDNTLKAEAFYLQPQVEVESAWEHIRSYGDQVFEDLDVPLRMVRGMGFGAESGVAVAQKYAPLLKYVKARQGPFAVYEHGLAAAILRVAGAFYGLPNLAARADDLTLDVAWREPTLPLDETQTALDQWELSMGLISRVQVLMRRHGLTRRQAIEHLEQMAEDNAELARILPDAAPPGPPGDEGEGDEAEAGADDEAGDEPEGNDA